MLGLLLACRAPRRALPLRSQPRCRRRATAFAPGVRYDPAIPTLRQVVGHDWGEEITTPDGIAAYLKALNAAAPDRTRLVEYARSRGRAGRSTCSSWRRAERIARLDEVKADLRRLADPRGLAHARRRAPRARAARRRVADARRARQRDLLVRRGAARGLSPARRAGPGRRGRSCATALVLIDPLQNPDGRARFVAGHAAGPRGRARRRAARRRARRALARAAARTTTCST